MGSDSNLTTSFTNSGKTKHFLETYGLLLDQFPGKIEPFREGQITRF